VVTSMKDALIRDKWDRFWVTTLDFRKMYGSMSGTL